MSSQLTPHIARRPATLKEIAARAGVAPATASVVLNGSKSGTRISKERRELILQVAQEMNYRPNQLARSLRMSRTNIIGFFSGYNCIDPRNDYIASIMGGLQFGCVQLGLDLLLFTPHEGLSAESIAANLTNGRMDGLVVTARPEHPLSRLLAESHLPVVAISDPLPDIPSVVADSEAGGRMQARHLAEKGHKRVLYVPADYAFVSVIERYEGFCEEASLLGLEVTTGHPMHGNHPECGPREDLFSMRLQPEEIDLLRSPGGPTAVVVWDDAPAHRVATQLVDAGLCVPGDVAVVGYNGCVSSTEPRWRLTTVRAPWHQIGAAAITVLHSLIQGEEAPSVTTLPVELIPGATS